MSHQIVEFIEEFLVWFDTFMIIMVQILTHFTSFCVENEQIWKDIKEECWGKKEKTNSIWSGKCTIFYT